MGHLEVVESLIIAKIYMNAKITQYYNWTTLLTTFDVRYLEIINRLLIVTADVNTKTDYFS